MEAFKKGKKQQKQSFFDLVLQSAKNQLPDMIAQLENLDTKNFRYEDMTELYDYLKTSSFGKKNKSVQWKGGRQNKAKLKETIINNLRRLAESKLKEYINRPAVDVETAETREEMSEVAGAGAGKGDGSESIIKQTKKFIEEKRQEMIKRMELLRQKKEKERERKERERVIEKQRALEDALKKGDGKQEDITEFKNPTQEDYDIKYSKEIKKEFNDKLNIDDIKNAASGLNETYNKLKDNFTPKTKIKLSKTEDISKLSDKVRQAMSGKSDGTMLESIKKLLKVKTIEDLKNELLQKFGEEGKEFLKKLLKKRRDEEPEEPEPEEEKKKDDSKKDDDKHKDFKIKKVNTSLLQKLKKIPKEQIQLYDIHDVEIEKQSNEADVIIDEEKREGVYFDPNDKLGLENIKEHLAKSYKNVVKTEYIESLNKFDSDYNDIVKISNLYNKAINNSYIGSQMEDNIMWNTTQPFINQYPQWDDDWRRIDNASAMRTY